MIVTRKIGKSAAHGAVQTCNCYTTGRQLRGSPGGEGRKNRRWVNCHFLDSFPANFLLKKTSGYRGYPYQVLFYYTVQLPTCALESFPLFSGSSEPFVRHTVRVYLPNRQYVKIIGKPSPASFMLSIQ